MTWKSAVEEFFALVDRSADGLVPTVSYVAWKRRGIYQIIKARLIFALHGRLDGPRIFKAGDVIAETFQLNSNDASAFVENVASGKLIAPAGDMIFPPQDHGSVAAFFHPLHGEGLQQQKRFSILQLTGSSNDTPIRDVHLDWELMSASAPYDSINELCLEFGVGPIEQLPVTFEAVLTPVVEIGASSRVNDAKAEINLLLAPTLDSQKASLGYRVFEQGVVAHRGEVAGEDLEWSDWNDVRKGAVIFDVPPAAAVHCYARFDGVTHHHYWIADPSTAQNPRRAAYEKFDPELRILRELLVPEVGNAADLEKGVAWLLWLLGFSPIHLAEKRKRVSNAPDLLAVTPAGHHVVVECTMGQLKGDSKMERLVGRAAVVRERLERSNNKHLRVLPLMVTSMTRPEVAAGEQPAKEQGVVILTREDLLAACDRTVVLPTPDAMFEEAEQSLT